MLGEKWLVGDRHFIGGCFRRVRDKWLPISNMERFTFSLRRYSCEQTSGDSGCFDASPLHMAGFYLLAAGRMRTVLESFFKEK